MTAAACLGMAILLAAIGTIAIRRHAATLGLMDSPNERSSHRVVTPRGGGLAIIAAAIASLAVLASLVDLGADTWILAGAATVIGVIGAIDDRRGLPALVRFVLQLGVAVYVVAAIGPVSRLPLPPPLDGVWPPAAGWVFSLLWLVAVTNFFNFMDGIDGLAAGQAAASCAGVAAAAWSADAVAIAIAAGGASAGFLVHNWPPARVFMGDSGSGFLGFTLAGLPLLAPAADRPQAVIAVAAGLALFLLDPLLTLFRRARAGKNVLQAHREHLYQQLAPPAASAAPVTTAYLAAGLLLALLGAVGFRVPALAWLAIAASVAAFAVVWYLAEARRGIARQSN